MQQTSAFLILSSLLIVSNCNPQFPQYPQYPTEPLQPNFGPLLPFRRGGYQLRTPPQFNPYDNFYNPQGEKLTCKTVCSPVSEVEEITEKPEKKDAGEGKKQ